MNVKTLTSNINLNIAQSELFAVYEEVHEDKAIYLVCSKTKKIKITPMYKRHKTLGDEVFYKIELLKLKSMIINGIDYGNYEPISREAFNVSSIDMQTFLNFLLETFELEKAQVNTLVSVDSKGAARELFSKYQKDKTFFDTLTSVELDSINANITLQSLKNIRNEMQNKMEMGKERTDWQPFLKKYSWILSQLFIAPYTLFAEEFYLGGKNYSYKGGIKVDFATINSLTQNCAIIEIKDANQPLIGTYRKDGELRVSDELAGALSQLLKDRDYIYKNFTNIALINGQLQFKAHNIRSILIIGQNPSDYDQMAMLENFRNELRNVEIITFNELLKKIDLQINMIESNWQ